MRRLVGYLRAGKSGVTSNMAWWNLFRDTSPATYLGKEGNGEDMPKVLNKRTGQILPDAVYVGRPSKWGNPMTVRELRRLFPNDTTLELQQKAVEWFREYINVPFGRPAELMSQLDELRGKDLICWCTPLPCHGDILLELANQ